MSLPDARAVHLARDDLAVAELIQQEIDGARAAQRRAEQEASLDRLDAEWRLAHLPRERGGVLLGRPPRTTSEWLTRGDLVTAHYTARQMGASTMFGSASGAVPTGMMMHRQIPDL